MIKLKTVNQALVLSVSALISISSVWGTPILPSDEALKKDSNATVPYVDINKYMGDWYVIASDPTYLEKGCHNAIESYSLLENGKIENTFKCNMDGFEGPKRNYSAVAWVHNIESNAEWRVRFFWVLTFPYLIIEYDSNYQYTVVGYPNFEHVWIMSRTKTIPQQQFNEIIQRLAIRGYNIQKIKLVPQQ